MKSKLYIGVCILFLASICPQISVGKTTVAAQIYKKGKKQKKKKKGFLGGLFRKKSKECDCPEH